MPELPEVETTLRGIQPYLENQKIKEVIVRHHQLRWRIPKDFASHLQGKIIHRIERRGKYLIFHLNHGAFILHLGMSGRLHLLTQWCEPQKHDHVDILFADQYILRFTDPRRFGALLWVGQNVFQHPLLAKLGPEPLTKDFSGKYLWQCAQSRSIPIKSFIMNNQIVVGIGNIYATEALFRAGIHPKLSVKKISLQRMEKLAKACQHILRQAIKQGGTTLKDFLNSEGKPGYFIQKLKVYARQNQSCVRCDQPLRSIVIAHRTTVFCAHCQK